MSPDPPDVEKAWKNWSAAYMDAPEPMLPEALTVKRERPDIQQTQGRALNLPCLAA